MTAALLAAYPDVFAGGAVVAGLPVGAAATAAQALMRMAHAGPKRTPDEWAAQVRGAVPPGYRRGWPRISIWHGASDSVVDPHNADILATQWGAVHGLGLACDIDVTIGAVRHRTWAGKGRTLMEQWSIQGMGHGYPIDGKSSEAAPYILDVNLPTTRRVGDWPESWLFTNIVAGDNEPADCRDRGALFA
jgi:poly(3-hydroxybutyrate) depolymerase